MKTHTSGFKDEIKTLGKQQSVRITYKENNVTKTLTDEDINSATPNYEASLLKSVMKVLELDSNVSIPKGTEIKFEYGLLVNGTYEYLDYGNYIVAKEPEKQEDTLSYKITCYDKLLYSMKDYEHIEVNYPCKIKKFLIELCKKIGLEFKDSTFANQDREFANELFMTINEDGTYSSMGYTYRDVLDQIAETTGGCICMTLDDKVEVRYINELYNKKSVTGNPIYITDSIESELTINKIEGSYKQDKVTSSDYPQEVETVGSNVNLFDKESATNNKYLSTTDGALLNSSSSSTSDYINVEGNKNYIISGYENNNYYKVVCFYDKDKNFISAINTTNSNTEYAFATPTNTRHLRFHFQYTKINDIKLEKGTKATPYSPYGQGSVEVIKQNKNLLNKNLLDRNVGYPYGTAGVVPQPWRGLKNRGALGPENAIKIKPNTNYVVTVPAGIRFGVAQLESDLKSLGDTGWLLSTKSPYTLVTQPNAQYIGFNFGKDDNSDFTDSEWDNFVNGHLQFEEGSVATNFVEHQEEEYIIPVQQEMLEGDYIDSTEHHEWGKIVLDGTESWAINRNAYNLIYFYYGYSKVKPNTVAISNMLRNKDIWTSHTNQDLVKISVAYKTINIMLSDTTIDTVAGLKSLLKSKYDEGNPVIIYYKLATPVDLALTEEQKAVKNTLINAYEPITNVYASDSLAKLDITYANSKETIDEEYINDVNVNFGEKYRTN